MLQAVRAGGGNSSHVDGNFIKGHSRATLGRLSCALIREKDKGGAETMDCGGESTSGGSSSSAPPTTNNNVDGVPQTAELGAPDARPPMDVIGGDSGLNVVMLIVVLIAWLAQYTAPRCTC